MMAKQMLQSLSTVDGSLEDCEAVRKYYLDTHVRKHYSNQNMELFHFKDGSILQVSCNPDNSADITAVPAENVIEYSVMMLQKLKDSITSKDK